MDLFNALNFSDEKDVLEMAQKLAEFVDQNNWVEKFGLLKIKKAFQATLAVGEMSEGK